MKRATQQFAVTIKDSGGDNVIIVLDLDTDYADNHPAVVLHPELFVPAVSASPQVEQMTAAPGEKRQTRHSS